MEKLVVGILAHVDAGKTTLSEGILYLTGKIRKLGRVDHKDAYLDTYNLERERGITIFPSRRSLNWETGDNSSGYAGACGFLGGDGENTAGSGLCHPCNQWSGWCAGTYHDLMETSGKIPDPDVPVYQ